MTTDQVTQGAGGKLAEVLLAPSGLIALALAAGGILLLVLRPRLTRDDDEAHARALDHETTPPPLLETTLIAPASVRAARSDKVLTAASAVAFGAVGIAVVLAMIAVGPKLVGAGEGGGEAPRLAEAAPRATITYQDDWPGEAMLITASRPDGCEEGLAGHAEAYTSCGGAVPLRFEVIDLARDGERVLGARWAGADKRAFVLEAKGQPAPFTLDGQAAMIAAPGSALGAYDAVLAIGTAATPHDGEGARFRAEARSLALQDFVLAETRGAVPADCRSDLVVHAVSLGATEEAGEAGGEPAPRPILIGVRAEDRINRRAPMEAGALDALIDDFLTGQGATILGVTPEAYGPWQLLSSERACARGPA